MGLEWFALLIPIILGLIAKIFFPKRLAVIEIAASLLIVILAIVIFKAIFINSLTSDEEYISEYPIKIEYYEDWNEYIDQTCYQTCCCDDKGNNCSEIPYDCSYIDYHREYWVARTNMNNSRYISKKQYDSIKKLWNNETFVDLHRDYHTNDGDKYVSSFDNVLKHVVAWTYTHTYENKPQTAYTLFHFDELTENEKVGLYEYPKVNKRKQLSCLGCNQDQEILLEQFNSYMGKEMQIKIFVLLFDGDIEIAERQRKYWKNGNKNELIICLNKNLEWAKSFSWCDDKSIEVEANELFIDKDISINNKLFKLSDLVHKHWVRKEFSSFNYIKVPLKNSQMKALYIISVVATIICLIIGIYNDFDETII